VDWNSCSERITLKEGKKTLKKAGGQSETVPPQGPVQEKKENLGLTPLENAERWGG